MLLRCTHCHSALTMCSLPLCSYDVLTAVVPLRCAHCHSALAMSSLPLCPCHVLTAIVPLPCAHCPNAQQLYPSTFFISRCVYCYASSRLPKMGMGGGSEGRGGARGTRLSACPSPSLCAPHLVGIVGERRTGCDRYGQGTDRL